MVETTVSSRVRTGVPWWLSALVLLIVGSVGVVIVKKLVPVDPDRIFRDALQAYDIGNPGLLDDAVRKLEPIPTHAGELEILRAVQLIRSLRPLKAIPILKQAAELPHVRAYALAYLGQAQSHADELLEAVNSLRRSIEADSTINVGYALLSQVLYELGAWKESLEVSQVLTSRPTIDTAAARRLRGAILGELGKFEEAAAELQAALRLEPVRRENRRTAMILMTFLNRTGEYRQALQYAEIAEKSPEMEAYRAEALLGIGNVEAAAAAVAAARNEMSLYTQGEDGPGADANRALRRTLGKVALKQGKDRASAVLSGLSSALPKMAGDIEFLKILVDLANLAEKPEDAAQYQKSLAETLERRARFAEARDEVSGNLTDGPGRIKVGDLAADLGQTADATLWYIAAMQIDPSTKPEATAKLVALRGK